MLKYVIKRLLQSVITIFLIATAVFVLMRMLPPEKFYFDPDEEMYLTEESKEDILRQAGLLDPLHKQLLRFYEDTLEGDFGVSRRIQRDVPVTKLISKKVGISMKNGAMAMGISLLVGVTMGVLQTLNKDGLLDHLGTGYTIFVRAVPTIVSFSLILVFGTKVLGLPSLYSSRKPEISNIMPVFCLAMVSIAGYALWTRRYMVDELTKDYIKMARIKGLSSRQIMFRHVLKNAFVPLVQYLPASLLDTIGGSLLVERFFSVPGMGTFLADAISKYDVNVVQTLSMLYATLGVLGTFLGDVLMTIMDPRISLQGKEETR
mgnify:CR=1 FL=1